MIYSPSHFQVNDKEMVFEFIRQNPFATIISCTDNAVSNISKIPLMFKKDGDKLFLEGHFARPNLHWKKLAENSVCTVIFDGAHSYISPTWYRNPKQSVPTWNYSTVVINGNAEIIDSPVWIQKSVMEFSERFEQNQSWQDSVDKNFIEKLSEGIIGISIVITEIHSKFKLSQNRSEDDQSGVIERLSESNPLLAKNMKTFCKSRY